VGGEIPHLDDVEDIFNLLDVNGDETIDRHEFESIMTAFFKLLNEKHIDVSVEKESDIIL
jgi:Ca2+-binding EF-hand superfamily protein